MPASAKLDHRRSDVLIVGGGVNGCSLAYRLAKRGKRVRVIERRGIASGASGRNGGNTGAGSPLYADKSPSVYQITSANWRMMQEIERELGVDIQFRKTGAATIATTSEEHEHLKETVTKQQDAGQPVELLELDAARERIPTLGDAVVAVEFGTERGHLWPFDLVYGLADNATHLGVDFVIGVDVERLLTKGDRVVGVSSSDGDWLADEVVLATNAWTPHLLELPDGALVPARGQILATESVAPGTIPCPFDTNFDKEYGRQTAGGQIVCGGFRRFDLHEGLGVEVEHVTAAVLAGIGKTLTTLFPTLASVRVMRCWAGIMGFTADGLPLIGRYPELQHLTVVAGFNGNGFSWALAVGEIVAGMLSGETVEVDLSPFDPGRFATEGFVWDNPFTAGETSASAVA
ncbi:MAG: FAD-binding oxidoreductase [Chloroflexia bacterium]|nr:FAD-binding oxidoreductase [Chloroflexia bacterium]